MKYFDRLELQRPLFPECSYKNAIASALNYVIAIYYKGCKFYICVFFSSSVVLLIYLANVCHTSSPGIKGGLLRFTTNKAVAEMLSEFRITILKEQVVVLVENKVFLL